MSAGTGTIEAREIATLLDSAIRRKVSMDADGAKPHNGNLAFRVGRWRVVFTYYDGHLDYCDSVVAPDGRKADSTEWSIGENESGNPVHLLSIDDALALERILEQAIARVGSLPAFL